MLVSVGYYQQWESICGIRNGSLLSASGFQAMNGPVGHMKDKLAQWFLTRHCVYIVQTNPKNKNIYTHQIIMSAGGAQRLRCPQHPGAHSPRRLRVQPRRGWRCWARRRGSGFHQRTAGNRQPAAEDPQGKKENIAHLLQCVSVNLSCLIWKAVGTHGTHWHSELKHHTWVKDKLKYLLSSVWWHMKQQKQLFLNPVMD